MGYPSTDVFDIKFIERTKKNLEDFNGDNNFTNLINSLVGLIFIPHEYNNKGRRKNLQFLKLKISEIEDLKTIFTFQSIDVKVDGRVEKFPKFQYRKGGRNLNLENVEVQDLLRLVRNSIAHANLIPFGEDNVWSGIIMKNFQDKKKEKKDKYNFITVLRRKELETFAITISNLYLKEVNA